MLQRQLTAHYSQSKERNMKKIRLEALSNKQKHLKALWMLTLILKIQKNIEMKRNSQCMISFSDTPLLSLTILNSNENEKNSQTSNGLIEKSL